MHLYLSLKKETGTTDMQSHSASTDLELLLLSKNKPILFLIGDTQMLLIFMAYVSASKCILEQVAFQYSFGKDNSTIIKLRQPQTWLFCLFAGKQWNMFPIPSTGRYTVCTLGQLQVSLQFSTISQRESNHPKETAVMFSCFCFFFPNVVCLVGFVVY